MSNSEIVAKFNTLTPDQQRAVKREASEIQQFGRNIFWIETGLHADDSSNYWHVVKFAMERNYLI